MDRWLAIDPDASRMTKEKAANDPQTPECDSMNDFLKELNIIDILGIGVPGCLLVLLLGGDQTAALLWSEQFGNSSLLFTIALITAGSIAGMLVHELGDMIEKGLWLIPWMDPKTYAACAVTVKSIDDKKLKPHEYPVPEGLLGLGIGVVSFFAAVLVVFGASAVFPYAMLAAARVTEPAARMGYSVWWGITPLGVLGIGAIIAVFALCKKRSGAKIETIRKANPYIQTKLVGHGNTSKRTLYDGWRFVMRNLVLVWAIANVVSLWKPLDLYRQAAEAMVGDNGDMTRNLMWLTLMASCAISMMLVRYYHYAYLRYKYSLEDYIELMGEEPPAAEPPAEENEPPAVKDESPAAKNETSAGQNKPSGKPGKPPKGKGKGKGRRKRK